MKDSEYIKETFNEVNNLTAVCKTCKFWNLADYRELEIGKRYHISHIGVLRSSTLIMLSEFGDKQFNSACFDIYEDGNIVDYRRDARFWAPYLKELIFGA